MVCEVVFVQRSEIKQKRMAGFFGIILDVLGCVGVGGAPNALNPVH